MKIQISKIKENPNNPRHVFNQAEDDSLALSMQKQGQLVACVATRLRQGYGGQEQEYQLISGARRLRAAIKNNWTELECDISDKSEGDEAIELMLFNGGKKLFWLEEYEGIEYARSKNPRLSQKELAEKMGVRQQYISDVMRVLPLLNEAAKAEIYRIAVKSDGWEVPERAIITLTAGFEPTPANIDLMERAVKVLIQHKMTIKQAKRLAEWVKAGNSPEDFAGSNAQKAKSSKEDGSGLYEEQWQELRETGYFQIKRPSKGGIHIIIPDEDSAILAGFGAAGALWALERALRAAEEGEGVEQIKAGEVVSDKGDGTHLRQEASAGEPETRNQKLETSGNSGNHPMTMVKGILNQQITTASNDPIDQLKAKALNAGVGLLKTGAKKLLDHFKKDL
jgi:ParB/RepB/Spo0J family partition protein